MEKEDEKFKKGNKDNGHNNTKEKLVFNRWNTNVFMIGISD